MSGINQSTVKVTLRNPLDHTDLLDYYIVPNNTQLAQDWISALKSLLQSGNLLEKNFCFMGFPKTARSLPFLCNEVNQAITVINDFFPDYQIEEYFTPENIEKTIQEIEADYDLIVKTSTSQNITAKLTLINCCNKHKINLTIKDME